MPEVSPSHTLHASFPSAGFGRRVAAWVYDILVAVAVIMLSSARPGLCCSINCLRLVKAA